MAITTKINQSSKLHDSKNGGGGSTIILGGVSNAQLPTDPNFNSITAANGNIKNLSGNTIQYTEAGFLYLNSNNGKVVKLQGDEIKYALGQIDTFKSDNITTGKLNADDIEAAKAWIENLNSKNITTEYLTVTKQAHFFELIIDKIKSVGGQLIITPANCVIDWVKAHHDGNDNIDYYEVYWRAYDDNGHSISNDWWINDQALCQSFNATEGTSFNVSNKYYWRLVTGILPDVYMNINTGATTTQANAGVNSVTITNPSLTKTIDGTTYDAIWGWNITPQVITGMPATVTWTQTSGGMQAATAGTMTTQNTFLGIELAPMIDSQVSKQTGSNFTFICTAARLNIGIYYTDDTSEYHAAPATSQTTYNIPIKDDVLIERITITNADEVEWHLVHGIKLSNTIKDNNLPNHESVPEKGDNLVQLGYRYNQYSQGAPEYDVNRASAIIISAYRTPDQGAQGIRAIKAPSYAQYTKITDFNLAAHRQSFFDAEGARFVGDFYVGPDFDDSENIMDIIDGIQAGAQGPQGAQGNTGPQGTQGIQGNDGEDAEVYKLVDWGSQARYYMQLNSNNDATVGYNVGLKCRIAKTLGAQTHYMTVNEMDNWGPQGAQGLWPYVRDMQGPQGPQYYKMSATGTSTSPILAYEKSASGSGAQSYVDNNSTFEIALLNSKDDIRPITVTNIKDTLEIPFVIQSSAQFQVVNGQQSSIRALVTGQQTLSGDVSDLNNGIQGIQNNITSLTIGQQGIQSEVTQITKGTTNTWTMPLYDWYAPSGHLTYGGNNTYVYDDVSGTGDLYSPIVYIKKGEYAPYNATVKFEVYLDPTDYNNHSGDFSWCTSATYQEDRSQYATSTQMTLEDTGETSGTLHKYAATFTTNTDIYLWINANSNIILYKPVLTSNVNSSISSDITQTANNISLAINQGLQSTGINIGPQTIELRGDKVTFRNTAGTQTDKIWIDPNDGTLHAVNGDFSGKVTATSGTFSGTQTFAGSQAEFKIEINGDDKVLKLDGPALVESGTMTPTAGTQTVNYFTLGEFEPTGAHAGTGDFIRAKIRYFQPSSEDGNSGQLLIFNGGEGFGFYTVNQGQQSTLQSGMKFNQIDLPYIIMIGGFPYMPASVVNANIGQVFVDNSAAITTAQGTYAPLVIRTR